MKIYYILKNDYGEQIRELDVLKVSEKSYWIKNAVNGKPERFSKENCFQKYFDSKKEAIAYLEFIYNNRMLSHENSIKHLKARLKELEKYELINNK